MPSARLTCSFARSAEAGEMRRRPVPVELPTPGANAGKMNGRTFETTNAPVIGDKSVAERSEGDVERLLEDPAALEGMFAEAREARGRWLNGEFEA